MAKPAKRPYKLGYRLPVAAKRLLSTWKKTNVLKSVGTALQFMGVIAALGIANDTLRSEPLFLRATFYLLAAPFIGRSLRGLECLVHEGGHGHWFARQLRLNDTLTNLLAAFPVFAIAREFRKAHSDHHQHLGTEIDPCEVRYVEKIDLAGLDRTSFLGYCRTMMPRLVQYELGWLQTAAGSGRWAVLFGTTWHAVALAGMGMYMGPAMALRVWFLYFAIPFVFVLPPIRFVAEASEHDYKNNDGTIFSATFINAGLIHWFFHPCGDGYHALHHLVPCIPHHRLRQVDRWLVANDPEYRMIRRRSRVLEEA